MVHVEKGGLGDAQECKVTSFDVTSLMFLVSGAFDVTNLGAVLGEWCIGKQSDLV